jgi:Siphovirus Gp157
MSAGQLTLYENVAELLELVEAHSEAQSPEEAEVIRGQVLAQIDRTRTKVDRVRGALSHLSGIEVACQREIDRLTKLRNAAARNRAALEGFTMHTMIEAGLQRLEGHHCIFKLATSPGNVEIDDAAQVPEAYKRETIVIDIDRAAILKALRAGESVPGARLARRPLLKAS